HGRGSKLADKNINREKSSGSYHGGLAEPDPVRFLTPESRKPDAPFPVELPAFGSFPRDLPVYGMTVGGREGDFTFNGQTVDYVPRAPGLGKVKDAFALFVANDSMKPWKEHGDIVYLHPGRPARPGDYVVVELRPTRDGEAGVCLVKRLRQRNNARIVLEQ